MENDKYLFDCNVNEKLVNPIMDGINTLFHIKNDIKLDNFIDYMEKLASIKSDEDMESVIEKLKDNIDSKATAEIMKMTQETVSVDSIRYMMNKAITTLTFNFDASTYVVENLLCNIEKHFKEVKFTDSTIFVYHPENLIDKIVAMIFLKSVIDNLIYFSFDKETQTVNNMVYGVDDQWFVLQNQLKGSMFPSAANKPTYMRTKVLAVKNQIQLIDEEYKFRFVQLLTDEEQKEYDKGIFDLFISNDIYIAIEGVRDAEYGFQIDPYTLCVSTKPGLVFGYKTVDNNIEFKSIKDLTINMVNTYLSEELKVEDTESFKFCYPERTLDDDIPLMILDKMLKLEDQPYAQTTVITEELINKFGLKKVTEFLASAYDHKTSDMNLYPVHFSLLRTGFFGPWCATYINIQRLALTALAQEEFSPVIIDIYKLPKSTYKIISIHTPEYTEDECRDVYQKYIPKILNPITGRGVTLKGDLEIDDRYTPINKGIIGVSFIKNPENLSVPHALLTLIQYNEDAKTPNELYKEKYYMSFSPPDAIPMLSSALVDDPITNQPGKAPMMVGILTRVKIHKYKNQT